MTSLAHTFDVGKRFAKQQALTRLPEWVLTPLRRRHYRQVLKNISESYDSHFVVLKELVKPGDRVIDLGAHVGACTKFLSDLVGERGRVYSVEPFPMNFDILSSNVRKLGLANVELINCAVSDLSGTLVMEVPTFAEYGESFYDARLIPAGASSSLRQAEVTVNTVDNLLRDFPGPISFIKCDVEGQELQTLKGAQKLIGTCRPLLQLEISLMEPGIHEQVRQLLERQNYQEFCFEDGTLRIWQHGDRPVDVFFMQPSHLLAASEAGLTKS